MSYTRISRFLGAAVVLISATACSATHAAPPLTTPVTSTAVPVPAAAGSTTTTVEIDGGACRLGAIRVCP